MPMNDSKQVLELCVRVGQVLLRNGGEIFRVQETMERIAAAYGVESFNAYVLTNGVFASIDENGQTHSAEIRMVPLSPVHLGRVSAVNSLSREIAQGMHTIEEAFGRIEEISRIPPTSTLTQIISAGFGSGCFCFIFGGEPYDWIAATVAGAILWVFVLLAGKWNLSRIMTNILGSALVAVCCIFASMIAPDAGRIDRMVIGSIVPLLPGVPLTNSIRDFLNGDYLSGTIRLIDAVLIACCIAIGVGLVLKVHSLL